MSQDRSRARGVGMNHCALLEGQGKVCGMATKIAVIFGGRSPEHDVSIKTGLQALDALDQRTFDAFPVYIGLDGTWWVGDALRKDGKRLPDTSALSAVRLERRFDSAGGRLVATARAGLFRKTAEYTFDVALLALHGLNGEDGRLQGWFELYGVPYTGMRLLSSALLMDKGATKRILAQSGVPMLPFRTINRPIQGLMPSLAEAERLIAGLEFPLIVKPTHLGSSIGVARVETLEELRACLPPIFLLDTQAIVETCVPDLVEYNIAVATRDGAPRTSAIERPKSSAQLLDFKEKYLSGSNGKKGAAKVAGAGSQGMLSLTRDINPDLQPTAEVNIRRWAQTCYALTGGAGAPRIDFLSNATTGEIWLNEVNPCPGSFAYFLWEAADPPVAFPELLDTLIREAMSLNADLELPADPTLPEARLYPRS